jgi:hypothetical protein
VAFVHPGQVPQRGDGLWVAMLSRFFGAKSQVSPQACTDLCYAGDGKARAPWQVKPWRPDEESPGCSPNVSEHNQGRGGSEASEPGKEDRRSGILLHQSSGSGKNLQVSRTPDALLMVLNLLKLDIHPCRLVPGLALVQRGRGHR